MQTIATQTIQFIEQAIEALDNIGALNRTFFRHFYPHYRNRWWTRDLRGSVEDCVNLILELERMASNSEQKEMQPFESVDLVDNRYPIFHDTVDVVPIYKDAIALECHRPLVLPKQIPRLLYLLNIPGYAEGMEVENHGFGYHFHYGKIKSKTIVRTNLLLTFDPQKSNALKSSKKGQSKKPLLYGEQHAEGKTKSIEMGSIGNNKRLPIYLVCLGAGEKRGLGNFKAPGTKAKIFHSGEVAV